MLRLMDTLMTPEEIAASVRLIKDVLYWTATNTG